MIKRIRLPSIDCRLGFLVGNELRVILAKLYKPMNLNLDDLLALYRIAFESARYASLDCRFN